MDGLGSTVISGARYVYLAVFFVLLAGFFHPIITGSDAAPVVSGTLVLFMGLGGTILIFKSATSNKRRGAYLGAGFGIVAVSLVLILLVAGRL